MNQTTMNYNEQQPQPTIPPIYTQVHPHPHPHPHPPHYQSQPHYHHHQYPQQPNPTNPIIPSINHQPPQSYDSYALTYTTQPTHYVPSYDVPTNAFTSYHHDPNWVPSFGVPPLPYSTPNNNIVPPNGVQQQYVTPNYDLSRVTNPAVLHRLSKKHLKIPNVSLSVRCDVCKILCDTHDVLEKHRLGKKHKKNLEKLKATVAGGPTVPPNGLVNPVTSVLEIPDTSKPGNGQTSKKKAASTPEDLEKKRRKVLDGGTAIDSVRMCSICNVVCNSETVFQAHLAGKMHTSKLKKQARATKPGVCAAKLS